MNTSWHSYPKSYNIGHKALEELFTSEVVIEEKVDGSQFSFGIFNGELKCRSKNKELDLDNPEKMFSVAVDYIKSIKHLLKDGFTYRAEYLQRNKHNLLTYDRVPVNNLIVCDINPAEETYLTYSEKKAEAARIGLETVPLVYEGVVSNLDQFASYMETVSVLGGQKVEGVVVKNYQKFGADKKILFGKYVSEMFKEVKGQWGKLHNPSSNDIIETLVKCYKTEARYHKAVQHLKEQGLLEGTPKDIGLLMKEVQVDTYKDCEEEIKGKLFEWAWKKLSGQLTRDLPQWYKDQLMKEQKFNA